MKKVKCFLMLLLVAACMNNNVMSQIKAKTTGQGEMSTTQIYEKSKSLNELMKGVSLSPRSNATTDDKKLLKLFENVGKLSLSLSNTTPESQSSSDIGQHLQYALQRANNVAKLRKTGNITLFPNDCYDKCDDQVGFGAAWNEFFCVFRCFKAAVVHFD